MHSCCAAGLDPGAAVLPLLCELGPVTRLEVCLWQSDCACWWFLRPPTRLLNVYHVCVLQVAVRPSAASATVRMATTWLRLHLVA